MLKTTIQIFLITIVTCACKEDYFVKKIEGQNIDISLEIKSDSLIDNFIEPFKTEINNSLDSTIAFSPRYLSKKDLDKNSLNTAVGNFMADAVFEMATDKISKSESYPSQIDFVLLNHGGIRSSLPQGNLSKRTAFQLMPFENAIVLVDLTPEGLQQLLSYLAKNQRAHPVSGLKLEINNDGEILDVEINNHKVDPNKNYVVATNDYLLNGGDKMTFLQQNNTVYNINYKIREALIDYMFINDTIAPISDNRFIYKNN